MIADENKIENRERTSLENRYKSLESQKDKLLDLYIQGSITQNIYQNKYSIIEQEQQEIEKLLYNYKDTIRNAVITLKTLTQLLYKAPELFEVSKNEEKRQIINLLFSKLLLDKKNPCFSIRKPIESILSIGTSQEWLETTCRTRIFK